MVYLVILLTVGAPVLMLELALGSKARGGDPKAFGSVHHKFAGIGMASVFGVYLIFV